MKDIQEIPERARAERLDRIRADLMTRIRPQCPGMPDELFIELVDSMAMVQLKYEMKDAPAVSSAL
jgi:hypothetical protein